MINIFLTMSSYSFNIYSLLFLQKTIKKAEKTSELPSKNRKLSSIDKASNCNINSTVLSKIMLWKNQTMLVLQSYTFFWIIV